MGRISKKLKKRFEKEKKKASNRWNRFQSDIETEMSPMHKLVREGYDPLHAAYVQAQNVASDFAEQLSQLPGLEDFVDIYVFADEEYMPSGPPNSPLTTSYFTTWAYFDCRFGPDGETIGSCMLDLAEVFEMSSALIKATQGFVQSRMGIYEVIGKTGNKIILRELLTNAEYLSLLPTGYNARPGELLYIRLCPPCDENLDYHVGFTSPYVLINQTAKDWTAFLRRTLPHVDSDNMKAALCQFMKYGPIDRIRSGQIPLPAFPASRPNCHTPELHYWNEFIFEAYHHHQQDAVFLAGLPDVKGSRPHADASDDE